MMKKYSQQIQQHEEIQHLSERRYMYAYVPIFQFGRWTEFKHLSGESF
jgi:hypothetical protein